MSEQIEYHKVRAEQELCRGLTAESMAAARAHLQLSWLHREQARSLTGAGATVKPPLVMS